MLIRVHRHFLSNEIIKKRNLQNKQYQVISDFLYLEKTIKKLEFELGCSRKQKLNKPRKITVHFKDEVRIFEVKTIYELLGFMEMGIEEE